MKSSLLKDSRAQMLILLVMGALAYAGTLQAPFTASEVQTLLADPVIQDFSKVDEIVRIDQVFNGSLPRLSFAVNYLMGHRTPWGYHLANLLIHLGVGLTFFWVVREWLILLSPGHPDSLRWLPFVAATIHLVHPLNTQAVILISSRPTLLGSLFYLLTFGFLTRFLKEFRENPKKARGSVDLLFAMACFGLGGASDPVMVTLPFMGWIFYRFYPASSKKMELEIFALAMIPWIIYLIYQFTTPAPELLKEASGHRASVPLLYFLTQIKAFVFYYLPKVLLPFHLNLDPDFRLVAGVWDWTWIVALLVIVLLAAGVRAARSPLVLWASLWTFLIFMSYYGLGMDDPVVSEPRFYLPGMGLHLLLATALVALGNRHPIAAWLRMGVPALFLILTFGRGQDYRSEISLWEETARSSPHKPRVHYELARAYLNAGSTDPAEKALAITLRLDSKHVPALVQLGEIYIQQKEYAKALNAYNELMRQGIKLPEVRFNSGLVLLALKRPKEAVPYLEEAVSRQPGSADWQLTLARAYHQSRRLQNALNHYRSTLQINPDQPVAHNEMGLVFWDLKSYFFADASFQKAYQLDPRYIDALNNLISSSMLFKQYDQTITYLNRLLEIHPKDDNAHQLLVAARRFQKQQESAAAPAPDDFH